MGTVEDFKQLGARVRLFRLGMGLDQSALARQCNMERTALSRIESGDRKVSALELVTIAEALGVSMVDIVSQPEPTVLAARSVISEEAIDSERDSFLAGVDLDRAWRDLCQLREGSLITPVQLPFGGSGLASFKEAQELAQETRKFLRADEGPLDAMTDVAAALGLWCRTTASKIDGLSFSPEPGIGVALVGQDVDAGRRRATVAHEIGHHVSGDTYEASSHFRLVEESENFVDAFAAELLLPSQVLTKLRSPTRDDMVRMAGRYRVSWSLLITSAQILEVDLSDVDQEMTPIDDDFYRVLGSKPEPDVVPPGLAKEWIQACVRAVDDELITRQRAHEMTCGIFKVEDV